MSGITLPVITCPADMACHGVTKLRRGVRNWSPRGRSEEAVRAMGALAAVLRETCARDALARRR